MPHRHRLLALLLLCALSLMLSPVAAQEQPRPFTTLQGLEDMARDTRSNITLVFTENDGDTVVTEFGAPDTFTVALSAQPTSTITLYHVNYSGLPTQPNILTFTPQTWDVPQTVTVYPYNNYRISASTYETPMWYEADTWINGEYQPLSVFNGENIRVTVNEVAVTPPTGALEVTTLEDSLIGEVHGSLRQMIHLANIRPGADTITFQAGLICHLSTRA